MGRLGPTVMNSSLLGDNLQFRGESERGVAADRVDVRSRNGLAMRQRPRAGRAKNPRPQTERGRIEPGARSGSPNIVDGRVGEVHAHLSG